MIDPTRITKFDATDNQLEEVLLFWVLVAGKTARSIARSLDAMLNKLPGDTPFEKIRLVGENMLPSYLKLHGVGCYRNKARALWALVNEGLNLRTCTLEELESIYGIGPKTARCFIIHSRPDANCAGLDTHILKFLRSKGHDVSNNTPSSKKQYRELEQIFLGYVKESGKSVAEFDLEVWNSYASKHGI
jgi:thermostable 8-oxoguanine DNA glycosylase